MPNNPYEFNYEFNLGDLTGGNTGINGGRAGAPVAGPQTQKWGGWNTENIWDYGNINEQAKQGMFDLSRDEIANQRDSFIQGYENSYRDAMMKKGAGDLVDEGGAELFNDPSFRNFVQTGQLPEIASTLMNNSLAPQPAKASGGGGDAISAFIQKLLEGGGVPDKGIMQARRESVKDSLDLARRGILEQNRADLASRGMLSLPGAPSGVEASSISNINDKLGSAYAGAIRDINTSESQAASDRLMRALGFGVEHEGNLSRNRLAEAQLQAETDRANRMFDLDSRRFETDSAFKQIEQLLASQLGLGRLELDRDIAARDTGAQDQRTIDQIIQDIINATRTGAEGYY